MAPQSQATMIKRCLSLTELPPSSWIVGYQGYFLYQNSQLILIFLFSHLLKLRAKGSMFANLMNAWLSL